MPKLIDTTNMIGKSIDKKGSAKNNCRKVIKRTINNAKINATKWNQTRIGVACSHNSVGDGWTILIGWNKT